MTKLETKQLNSEVKAFKDLFFCNLPENRYNFEEILNGNFNEISRLSNDLLIEEIEKYFSDFKMQKNCLKVIVKWTVFIIENTKRFRDIPRNIINDILDIYESFSIEDFKEIEKLSYDYYSIYNLCIENHKNDYMNYKWLYDSIATKNFFEIKMNDIGLNQIFPYIDSSLASSDILDIAYTMQIQALLGSLANKLYNITEKLNDVGSQYKQIHILLNYVKSNKEQRVSTIGREFADLNRIVKKCKMDLLSVRLSAKLNGECETYSNILINFPDEDWNKLLKKFVSKELNLHFDSSITLFEHITEIYCIIDKVKAANFGMNYIINQFDMYNNLNYLKSINDTGFEAHVLKNAITSYIDFINKRKEDVNGYYIDAFVKTRCDQVENFIQLYEIRSIYNRILVGFSLILDDIVNIIDIFTIDEIQVKQIKNAISEEIAKLIKAELENFGLACSLKGITAIVNGSEKDITKFLNEVNSFDIPVEIKRWIKEMFIYSCSGLSNYIANRNLW